MPRAREFLITNPTLRLLRIGSPTSVSKKLLNCSFSTVNYGVVAAISDNSGEGLLP